MKFTEPRPGANRQGAELDLLGPLLAAAREDGVGKEADLPFLFPPQQSGRGSVLLVHGFTATPWEMRDFGAGLAAAGYSCLGIRLPGHGTSAEDLAGYGWRDWLAAVREGCTLLHRLPPPFFGIGMSTGGLLLAALTPRPPLDGLVLLSPFLRLAHPLAALSGLLKRWIPYQERPLDGPGAEHYYSRRPLAGIAELQKLSRHLRRSLPKLTLPTLVLAAEGDQTVDVASGLELFRLLGSVRKEYHRFGPEVPHVLATVENPQQRRSLLLVRDFLSDLAAPPP